ncbi:MAG: SDR family NAD(P)-dependent oxidoreductase, partial [Candidatus Methylomirabilis sp.]|nr:SDR family NAD(P)-dependent oxidoreductase [Deltaproteobacteria bacterium]
MGEARKDPWEGRRVLVTGATGLLGVALCRTLTDRGASVVALVRDWAPASALLEEPLISRVGIVRGDVCDELEIERTLAEYETEVVLHAAAQTQVGVANREPMETLRVNVMGTAAVLDACRRRGGLRAIVVASSDKAYGAAERLPYTEETPLVG